VDKTIGVNYPGLRHSNANRLRLMRFHYCFKVEKMIFFFGSDSQVSKLLSSRQGLKRPAANPFIRSFRTQGFEHGPLETQYSSSVLMLYSLDTFELLLSGWLYHRGALTWSEKPITLYRQNGWLCATECIALQPIRLIEGNDIFILKQA